MAVNRAVGEPLGSRWEAVGKPLGLGVLGGSGAFGSVRERSGAGLLASRGQSGALRQTSDVGHERWGQLRQTSDVRRHKTPWAVFGGASAATFRYR